MNTAVRTEAAPQPAFFFSQGVVAVGGGSLLQVAGQGPIDPATGNYLHRGDVEAQTRVTLRNVLSIVEAGGGTLADVVMLRVYLTTRDDFAAMNQAYAVFMQEHLGSGVCPARTTVMVGLPHEDMLVEIDALAVVPVADD